MSKVFIVNSSGHDFNHAKTFGELIIMSENLINKFDVTAMYLNFSEYFKDANEDDYILLSGPTVMNMIAGSLFAQKFGRLNILIWKASNQGEEEYYVSRKLVFKDGNVI